MRNRKFWNVVGLVFLGLSSVFGNMHSASADTLSKIKGVRFVLEREHFSQATAVAGLWWWIRTTPAGKKA